jgi:hypothetical protein
MPPHLPNKPAPRGTKKVKIQFKAYPKLKPVHAPLPQERVQKERHVGLLDGLDKELLAELSALRKLNRDMHRLIKAWGKDVNLLEARGYPSWIRRPSRRPSLQPKDVVLHMATQVQRRLPKEFP